jgi:uncharacterized protein (DUF2141 family)
VLRHDVKRSLGAILVALLAACASAPAPAPAPFTPAAIARGDLELRVRVEGLRSSSGTLRVALFASEAGFPADAERALDTQSTRAGAGATVEFRKLAPGTYAVAVLHDENDNARLDTGFLGIPTEGLGASNDAQGRFGAADFEDAKLALRRSRAIVVRMRYFP